MNPSEERAKTRRAIRQVEFYMSEKFSKTPHKDAVEAGIADMTMESLEEQRVLLNAQLQQQKSGSRVYNE